MTADLIVQEICGIISTFFSLNLRMSYNHNNYYYTYH